MLIKIFIQYLRGTNFAVETQQDHGMKANWNLKTNPATSLGIWWIDKQQKKLQSLHTESPMMKGNIKKVLLVFIA